MKEKLSVKKVLLGSALPNEKLKSEKLSVLWGLPIMASDAVSSVSYAVEEILLALVPIIGFLSVKYVGWVSLPIVLLLLILIFSYSQIIKHYPNGGGAYVVSKENFGKHPSLVAAACLVIDYIMTVAVSISSSTAAIAATFPALGQHKVLISLVCIGIITLINLRGVSESSKVFGIPTYAFILSMFVMIATGLFRVFSGTLEPINYPEAQAAVSGNVQAMTVFLFLRAFSSGCSALTGVEAVSDAVPSFKDPSQKTAKHVLYLLGIIIVVIFGGTSILAATLKVMPAEGTTLMAQMANLIFGNGFMFYCLQITTFIILLLAANTAYSGLPILLYILAKDHYMPHQFAHRGTKLSFSNGIMFIFVMGAALLIAFEADTHKLIPFYAVGVFVSFTISQAGMFVRWIKVKENGWQYKSIINGVGAIITLIGTVVVFVTKFEHGSWVLLIAIPLIMVFMSFTHKHYSIFLKAIGVDGYNYVYKESKSHDVLPCIVMIHNMNKASLKTFDYAKDISSDVTVLHISTTPTHTEKLKMQWEEAGIGVPLTIIEAPYRNIFDPLEEYVRMRESQLQKGQNLTVVLTKFVGNGWFDKMFHNQTTFFIENKLDKHKNVATVLVPYIYHRKEM